MIKASAIDGVMTWFLIPGSNHSSTTIYHIMLWMEEILNYLGWLKSQKHLATHQLSFFITLPSGILKIAIEHDHLKIFIVSFSIKNVDVP